MRLFTNKRYKTNQTGCSFRCPCPRGGTWRDGVIFSEIQPILICELLTRMAHSTANFVVRASGRDQKVKVIKFQLQSQFQRFVNQTLCILSQMKDIKHIRQDFHTVAWGGVLSVKNKIFWTMSCDI